MQPQQDAYQGKQQHITDEIHRLRLLRDAQQPDSALQSQFQQDITRLTSELLEWEQAAGQLREVDRRVARASREVRLAQRGVERGGGWIRGAGRFGVAGGVVVVLSVVWTPTVLLPLAGVLLLAVAVGLLFPGVRARRAAQDELDRRQVALEQLRGERDELLPQG